MVTENGNADEEKSVIEVSAADRTHNSHRILIIETMISVLIVDWLVDELS